MKISTRARSAVASVAFAAAAACFALGLVGRSGSWLVAMVGCLGLLTVAYFIASGPSGDSS